MNYRPLPKEVRLGVSYYLGQKTGREEFGLFAKENIPSGTRWRTHVKTDDPVFLDGLIRLPMGGFFNHNSVDPNCKTVHTDSYIYLETIRDVLRGEELTATYTLYDPEEE